MQSYAAYASIASACVALLGCRASGAPAASGADPCPLDAFRVSAGDPLRVRRWERAWAASRRAAGRRGVAALALSGGGANGAFGAGVMVGWSQAGGRPDFDVVTGVSTGALMAPFVFAGAAWDERLRKAYCDPRLGALIGGRLVGKIRSGLSALFGASLVGPEPLARLIEEYADAALLGAIAAEHERGRRLLIATTNLDTQECVIWDLGAIALASLDPADAGRALHLFRSLLIASASVPGLLPPATIGWDEPGAVIAERHFDGCVSTPFILPPGTLIASRAADAPSELYVVINGNLDPTSRATRRGAVPTLLRALDTMSRANARSRVAAVEILAERHGATMACAAIPEDFDADPFNFASANRTALFELGRSSASLGQAFRTSAATSSAHAAPMARAA
jgi:predicted acylesterase/phospholipase RssA